MATINQIRNLQNLRKSLASLKIQKEEKLRNTNDIKSKINSTTEIFKKLKDEYEKYKNNDTKIFENLKRTIDEEIKFYNIQISLNESKMKEIKEQSLKKKKQKPVNLKNLKALIIEEIMKTLL